MDDILEIPEFEFLSELGDDDPAMAARNKATLRAVFEKMFAGDLNALIEIIDDDVSFHQAPGLPYGGEGRGIQETLDLFQKIKETWIRVKVDVVALTSGGDFVIALFKMDATSRATGQRYQGPIAEVFQFKNDKVIDWRLIYWDTAQVRKVCGLPGL